LYDELRSSEATVHGSSEAALAVGTVLINMSQQFKSPLMRGQVTEHRQPSDAERVIEKIKELPRRSSPSEIGFDALSIVIVDCLNDGETPVSLITTPPAPQSDDIFNYGRSIQRLAHLYEVRYGRS